MKRSLVLLVAAIGAAALLTGCGSAGDPAAAKVGSTTISRSTLDDELNAIIDNKAVSASFSKTFKAPINPTNGGVSTTFSTAWLTTLVNQAAIDNYFSNHDLKITTADKSAATASINSLYVNAATFKTMPKWFRTAVIARQNRLQAVKATLPKASDAQLQQILEQTKAQVCPSGQVVAHIQVASQADADAIEAQLASGADFGDLAKSKSVDTGSGIYGGLLACTGAADYQQLPAEFRAAADALTLGSVSAPVQIQNSFHIIKLAPWDVPTARVVLEQYYQQQANPLAAFINTQLLKKKVWVDPRYGTVKRTKAAIVIRPPVAPDPKSNPADSGGSTTTTTPAGATGQ